MATVTTAAPPVNPALLAPWQWAWRRGIAPQLSTPGLVALADALAREDLTLLQGGTTSPPCLGACHDWPVSAACPIAYAGWQGDHLETVDQVEHRFAEVCYAAANALGDPLGSSAFIEWWDDTPRSEAFRLLRAEVELALHERGERRVA